jgi:cell division protein FtsB
MRFRLLKRRLTISAPSMAIRSAMPWPIKWALAAVVLGFCAAISLWAFEFGKDLAGIDQGEKEQLAALQVEVAKLRTERDKAQSIANVSGISIATERATQEKLSQTVKQLESENQKLRDDLGFFERLIPSTATEALAIRGVQAEVLPSNQLKWQALVLQSAKNPGEFKGKLDVQISGILQGRPWSASLPGGLMPFDVKQFRRFDGLIDIPAQVQIKNITVKVMDNSNSSSARATQSLKL